MIDTISLTPHTAAVVQRSTSLPDVILIEDNPHDVHFLRLALSEMGVHVKLHVAEDPVHAFALMAEPSVTPAVIILDLNLPLIKGPSVLREMRTAGRWKDVPVIVLTSSAAEDDIDQCLELGANAYKIKPAYFDGYLAFARYLTSYLTEPSARLPKA
jgi:two-component system, chemotaxis family, response regulator Rcp1